MPNTKSNDRMRDEMRDDWDRRAREDASYYVAFGRRGQGREEFFETAAEVLRTLGDEFRRFPPETDFRKLAAIEIGCGPGRLMVPMSEIFGRVAGVDVSGEMVRLAGKNLAGIPHAEVRRGSGSDLAEFEDQSFDYCYSYAVFQHIPSADVVWDYLREARRVLKPGGLLKVQLNGLPAPRTAADPVPGWSLRAAVPAQLVAPPAADVPDTWSGTRLRPEQVARFAADENWQLLAMDGFDSQYLWVTARKPGPAGTQHPASSPRRSGVYRVTNTWTEDSLAPRSGRFASASLRGLDLPEDADLNRLRVEVNGVSTAPNFVGEYVWGGPTQVNFFFPPNVRSGLATVRLLLDGEPISEEVTIRMIGEAPMVPRLLGVSDGINLLSRLSIESRAIRVSLEEVNAPGPAAVVSGVRAEIGGRGIDRIEAFLVDPLTRRYELNLALPENLRPGRHELTLRLGRRCFPPTPIEIAPEPGEESTMETGRQ